MTMGKPGPSVGRALLSFGVAFVCSCVVWELAARNFVHYAAEPRLLPDGSQYYVGPSVKSQEGYSRLTFSKEGYRLPLPKGRKKHTVLVVGDSFTQAAQVSDSQTFTAVAQATLDEAKVDAALYNAGSAGLSPPAYVGVSSYYLKDLKPDTTVVQLNTIDFREDRKDKSRVYWAEAKGDTFELKKDPKKATGVLGPRIIQKIPGGAKAYQALIGFSLFQLALEKTLEGGDSPKPRRKPTAADLAKEEETVKAYVRWSVQELKKAYPNLVLVYIPTIDYFDSSAPIPSDETELELACRDQGVPLVTMRSAYLDEFKRSRVPAHGFSNTTPGVGHINSLGHKLLGEALAKTLREKWGEQ